MPALIYNQIKVESALYSAILKMKMKVRNIKCILDTSLSVKMKINFLSFPQLENNSLKAF